MLLYADIVKKALEQETLPLFREAVDSALTARFGEEWYMYFARPIMEGYAEFKTVDSFVQGKKGRTIEAFDISALCYLVMPYDKDLKMYLDGAMPMVEEKYGLDSNPERFKRLRTINSNVQRNKPDASMEINENNTIFGMQEKMWLLDIEKTLKEINPNLTFASYLKELDEAVAANLEKQRKQREEALRQPSFVEVREAYTKIKSFAFSEAPIVKPLLGAAPWAKDNSDLDKLPWPSLAGQEIPAQTQEQNMMAAMASIMAQNAANGGAQTVGAAVPQKPVTAAQAAVAVANAVTGGFNADDFLKPETEKDAAPVSEDAANEAAENEDVSVEETAAESEEVNVQKEKGAGKLFGWLKGKK